MQIILIAEEGLHRETLERALKTFGFDADTYSPQNLLNTSEFDLKTPILMLLSKENTEEQLKITKKHYIFALKPQNLDINDEFVKNLDVLFDFPIRIGHFLQKIIDFMNFLQQKESLKPIKIGDFTFNPAQGELLRENQGDVTALTDKEQGILMFLHAAAGAPVTRQQLLDEVWGYASGVETHTLETHIYRLRQKIEMNPSVPTLLVTNEDGYILNF